MPFNPLQQMMLEIYLSQYPQFSGLFGGQAGIARGLSPVAGGVPMQGGYTMPALGMPAQGGYSMFNRPVQGGYSVPYQGTPLTAFTRRFEGPAQRGVPQKRTGGGIEPLGRKKYYEPGSMIHLGDVLGYPGMGIPYGNRRASTTPYEKRKRGQQGTPSYWGLGFTGR